MVNNNDYTQREIDAKIESTTLIRHWLGNMEK